MAVTAGCDVYGTLIDTDGVRSNLQTFIGDRAEEFSLIWRNKQLEYAFRRGLMQDYGDFGVCTRDALEYACSYCRASLSDEQKRELLACYGTLPAFQDAAQGLASLHAAGVRLYAFSNGRADAVETVLANAGIRDCFLGVISVDDVKTFKPSPAVYQHFMTSTGALPEDAWLVSSNPFDVIGAISAGMHAAWVKRSPDAVFDPWGIKPTLTVSSLCDLEAHLLNLRGVDETATP